MNLAISFCTMIKLGMAALLLASAVVAIAPAQGESTKLPTASSLDLIKVPKLRQATDYTCGVCALQAVLAYYGDDVREDTLSRALKANPREGTRYQAIADYSKKHGYSVEIKKDTEVADLEAILKSGRPAICLIQAWAEIKRGSAEQKIDYAKDWEDGHYVVAIGFDKDNFYFMDPSTVGTYTYISRNAFLQRWHDTDGHERLNNFVMVICKDKPYDAEAVTELK